MSSQLGKRIVEKMVLGVRLGAINAKLEHKRNGVPMAVKQGDKIVSVMPEDIELTEEEKVLHARYG